MRSLITRLGAFGIAILACLAFAVPAFAASPVNVSATVTGSPIGVTVGALTGDTGKNIAITPFNVTYEASVPITIDDLSGMQAGWNLKITSMSLTGPMGLSSLPTTIKWDALTKVGDSVMPTMAAAGSNSALGGNAFALYSANSATGSGEFTGGVHVDYVVGPKSVPNSYGAGYYLTMSVGP